MADNTPEPQELETLAGEYVVGVLDAGERRQFESLAASVTDVAEARTRWENRLHGLNDEYGSMKVPASVKARIDERLFSSTTAASAAQGGMWTALGFWRGIGIAGTAAAIALGVYSVRLNEDLTNSRSQLATAVESAQESESQLKAFEGEIASRGQQLADLESEFASRGEQLTSLENEIVESRERAASLEQDLLQNRELVATLQGELEASSERLGTLEAELASAELKVAESEALLVQARADLEDVINREPALQVVSLESGETDYRFLAVHEQGTQKVRMTVVSGQIAPEQDYELWLVEPDKETVSLGVVPSGKATVDLTEEQRAILEAGGLLAISIEQKGGSPTGTAQGPVVAVGAPKEL